VFFVASSATDAVLVPLPALRPVVVEGKQRGNRGATSGDPRNQFANGRALVSVVDTDGKVADREVKVGVMNRVSAQIISGLEPGEKVVIGSKTSTPVARAQTSSSLTPNAARSGGHP
jgi:macrolide-specific efflux system membrane fusion protein